jgi:hypothetical protein
MAHKGYAFLKEIKTDDLRMLKEGVDTKLIAFFEIHFERRMKELAFGLLKEAPEATNMDKLNFNKGLAQGITEVRTFFHAIRDEYRKRTEPDEQPGGNADERTRRRQERPTVRG